MNNSIIINDLGIRNHEKNAPGMGFSAGLQGIDKSLRGDNPVL